MWRASAVVVVSLWAGSAQAESVTRTVRPGQAAPVAMLGTYNESTCQAGPVARWRVVQPPRNGTLVEIRVGQYGMVGSERCNFRSPAVFYRPRPGFTGTDEVAIVVLRAPNTLERDLLETRVAVRFVVGGGRPAARTSAPARAGRPSAERGRKPRGGWSI